VHAHRIADVLRALEQSGQLGREGRLGVSTLSVTSVNGLLPPLDERERHYSGDLAHEVIQEVKLEVMCEDDQVDAIVTITAGAAQTAQAQAGWVYVSDVLHAIPLGHSAHS
jgi:nitrogen regulatory protein P-II 1